MGKSSEGETAVSFEGQWREFAPIAVTNILLTFATLGFYRFWATARERRYFWQNTRFIDDHLEWTGTGKELFFGFLLALAAFGLPFLILNLVLQGLVLQGQQKLAGLMIVGTYLLLFYLAGVAIFRGLRYKLSRTSWHGIHGGTDDSGLRFGWSYLWKTVVAYICAAMLFPWSMTSLWKERWEAMSFGPHSFKSNPHWGSLMPRYLIAYLAPFGIIIAMVIIMVPLAMAAGATGSVGGAAPKVSMIIGMVALFMVAFYILWPLAALFFYAAYMREVVGTMQLSTIEFAFTARTKDWVKLFLGNVGIYLIAGAAAAIPLIVFGLFQQFADITPGETAMQSNPIAFIAFIVVLSVAFGLIGPFIRYRSWSFYVRHLEAGGEISLTQLTQSTTRELKQGEGLLDAFDIGAL